MMTVIKTEGSQSKKEKINPAVIIYGKTGKTNKLAIGAINDRLPKY